MNKLFLLLFTLLILGSNGIIGAVVEQKAVTSQDNDNKNDVLTENDQRLYRWKNADDLWGYIDKTGQVVIPCQWKGAWEFCEGLALVKDNESKYGYIDKTGLLVIPCQWKYAYIFKDGLARVVDSDGNMHYIDNTAKIVK